MRVANTYTNWYTDNPVGGSVHLQIQCSTTKKMQDEINLKKNYFDFQVNFWWYIIYTALKKEKTKITHPKSE